MSMFDYVDYVMPCRKCGAIISEWQTKSTINAELDMATVKPEHTENFYASCPDCGTRHEWRLCKD